MDQIIETETSSGSGDAAALPRTLSLPMLFALSFGTIIGVGWITVMGSWLTEAGSIGALYAFGLGGICVMLIALVYAEVALMFPVSGGEIAYAYRMFGPLPGFIVGWFLAFSYIAVCSFEAVSVAWLVDAIFPSGLGKTLYSVGGEDVRSRAVLIGFLCTGLIACTNYFGAKAASTLQLIMVGALLLAAIVFACVAFTQGDFKNLEPFFITSAEKTNAFVAPSLAGILGVFATTPFWFAGFDTIPQAMGEVKQDIVPRKLAYVILASIAASIVFYAIIIVASALSAPRAELLNADLPAAFAMEQAFQSKTGRNFVLVIGLCGLLSTWNAMFFASTRVIYTLSKARFIPPILSAVSAKYQCPSNAIYFVAVLSGLGALLGKTAIGIVASLSSLVLSIIFFAIIVGAIQLRSSAPLLNRPFVTPYGKLGLYTALFAALLVLLIAGADFIAAALNGDVIQPALFFGWAIAGMVLWGLSTESRNNISTSEREAILLSSDLETDLPADGRG